MFIDVIHYGEFRARYIHEIYARLCARTQTRRGINETYCGTRDPRINRGPCSRVVVKMSRSNDRHGDLARSGDVWYFTRSAAFRVTCYTAS